MTKNKSTQYVYKLSSTSQDGFGYPDPEWNKEKVQAGIVCSHCARIDSHRLDEIESVVVTADYVPKTHYSVVSKLSDTEIFSRKLFDLIGRERIEQLGRIVPIENNLGHKYTDFHCVLIDERRTLGHVRGSTLLTPTLCKVCGWLRYWPGWPPTTWYVLRRDWPEGTDLAHIGFLVCSPKLWKETIKPAKLKQMKGYKMAVLDEPTDGLPADYFALKEELRRRGNIE